MVYIDGVFSAIAFSCCTFLLLFQELLDYFEAEVDAKGLDALMPGAFVANYARPRRFEVRPSCSFCGGCVINVGQQKDMVCSPN